MPSPRHHFPEPPADARENPEVALKWIQESVPCFAGPVPFDWTSAILREAYRWGIPQETIALAMMRAAKEGNEFAATPQTRTAEGPRIKAASESKGSSLATARWLEARYRLAALANNADEKERIAKEFADLLNNLVGDYQVGPNQGGRGTRFHPQTGEEMMHGAPLLRRAIVQPTRSSTGPNLGPYRTAPVQVVPPRPPARGR